MKKEINFFLGNSIFQLLPRNDSELFVYQIVLMCLEKRVPFASLTELSIDVLNFTKKNPFFKILEKWQIFEWKHWYLFEVSICYSTHHVDLKNSINSINRIVEKKKVFKTHLLHFTNHTPGCVMVDTIGIGDAVARAVQKKKKKES